MVRPATLLFTLRVTFKEVAIAGLAELTAAPAASKYCTEKVVTFSASFVSATAQTPDPAVWQLLFW